ncbi:uncharacterized protein LOC133391345 [Anopheles gambiae]|uniref:uncharacterized protein LOC133391345 n=1 Tax=Anopheles gambiae TaxID=7165 RepID=UPI002AC8E52B|nr:uncharacterized protein LOC133391345 [Anopheles gambiae]
MIRLFLYSAFSINNNISHIVDDIPWVMDETGNVVPEEEIILDVANDDLGSQEEQEDYPGHEMFNFRDHSLLDCLRFWALKTNAPHSSVNIILRIFREKTEHTPPKDARTLLRTDKSRKDIVNIGGGRFWYNGVGKCLKNAFRFLYGLKRKINVAPNTTLELNLSVDGIPLHKSGRDTFWPVLMSVQRVTSHVGKHGCMKCTVVGTQFHVQFVSREWVLHLELTKIFEVVPVQNTIRKHHL